MKELSIEQKAQAYDEAISKMKEIITMDNTPTTPREIGEYLFSELKESEDDRIRNFISNELACLRATEGKGSDRYEELTNAITWLEKQGEQIDFANKEYWRGYREGKQEILDKYAELEKQDEQNNNEDADILQRFSFYSYKDEPNILYLSGIYVNEDYRNKGIGTKILKVADEVAASMKCNSIRLKTEKDSRAEKLYRENGYTTILEEEENQIWLEKQSEQKPVKNIVQIWKDMRFEIHMQASGDDMTRMFSLNDIDEIVEKISEQKLADKIEPKFHEGEWIIRSAEGFKHNTYLVKEVKDYYACEDLKGRRVTFTLNDVHKNFKLWDITKDAKDGDILAVEPLKDYPSPFIAIYKERGLNYFNSYCFIGFDGKFYTGDTGHDITDIHPATKEQCAQLEKAMTDAGYAFDFEKKELKKIEQKSAEWSKEDEEYMSSALRMIEHCGFNAIGGISKGAVIDWLKSLRPQKQWKPSKEQMETLEYYMHTLLATKHKEVLFGLYNDLKQLRKE